MPPKPPTLLDAGPRPDEAKDRESLTDPKKVITDVMGSVSFLNRRATTDNRDQTDGDIVRICEEAMDDLEPLPLPQLAVKGLEANSVANKDLANESFRQYLEMFGIAFSDLLTADDGTFASTEDLTKKTLNQMSQIFRKKTDGEDVSAEAFENAYRAIDELGAQSDPTLRKILSVSVLFHGPLLEAEDARQILSDTNLNRLVEEMSEGEE